MVKIAAVGVAAVLMAMQLREMKPEFGMYVVFGAGILIFFYGFQKLSSIVTAIEELGASAAIETKYLAILLKMLGISYVSEFAASLCKDSGYFKDLADSHVSLPVLDQQYCQEYARQDPETVIQLHFFRKLPRKLLLPLLYLLRRQGDGI